MKTLAVAAILMGMAFKVSAGEIPVVWAWERPEDLRFVHGGAEVAVQSGFVVLSGAGVYARGRRFPLLMVDQPETAMVHVQIDHHLHLAWTAQQRRDLSQAVLHLADPVGAKRVQVDFEVRKSERPILLDLLVDLRRALPKDTSLSMTALASWCDAETWVESAPVDEIVPMLFRMGPGGEHLKAKLEAGGDFANPRCRSAFAISTDAPMTRAPSGRRVYLFSPRSWTVQDYAALWGRMSGW
jgi:hypothetical protein